MLENSNLYVLLFILCRYSVVVIKDVIHFCIAWVVIVTDITINCPDVF